MVVFSDMAIVASKFKEYAEENGIDLCALNVITYLQVCDLLDEKNFKRYAKLLKGDPNGEKSILEP